MTIGDGETWGTMRSTIFLLICLSGFGSALGAEEMRRISVSGIGEVQVEPDRARVYLNAQAEARSTTEARRLVDEQLNGLAAALEAAGLDEDDLIAGQFTLAPQYDYGGVRRRFLGYLARRDVQVDVDDLERLNPLLDAALGEGIEGFQFIEYQTSREAELRAQARKLAVADSQRQAEELATAYGASLGPVISINYRNTTSTPYRIGQEQMMGMASFSAQEAASMPYVPGDLSFIDRVEVVFELLVD
ncbi:MAG: DUF541 domain-containing protein [Gammaproteobacteria bacterium]|nr:DUF541 domain-containing protein [Gammaproteobacteria bacterium]MYE30352.1 DUF541 domain-containing protein [Gammaproteobacteria bacterium]MYI00974.1 DUF541 domain-containing protein [Gammaproteobacteria bacterium]